MASHIAALGTIRYQAAGDGMNSSGTVTFPGDVTTKMVSNPIKSGDGRSIKYIEHTLTVSGWIFRNDTISGTVPASGTADNAFDGIKNTLQQSGGKLTITGKGWGDTTLNANTNRNLDVLFGPFPEVVEWEPFGNICCRFTWVVKFTLPRKYNTPVHPGVLDYYWTTSYKYDSEGFCDRTISGEIEIVGMRANPANNGVLSDSNIEKLLDRILQVDCPVGFHRKGHDIIIQPGRTKASFTFVDEQDRGFHYPPGISNMEIKHSMASVPGVPSTLTTWTWAFHAVATPEAKFPAIHAFQACVAAFEKRYLYMVRRLINQIGTIIPMLSQIKVDEDAKTRTTSLLMVYIIKATGRSKRSNDPVAASPRDILVRSGLWLPFDDFTAMGHKAVADGAFGPNNTGGFTQMVMRNDQNVIMDISALSGKLPDPGKAFANVSDPKLPNSNDTLVLSPYGMYIEFKVQVYCSIGGDKWINYPMTLSKNGGDFKRAMQDITQKYNRYAIEGIIQRVGLPPEGVPEITKIGTLDVVSEAGGNNDEVTTRPIMNLGGELVFETYFVKYLTTVRMDDSNPVKDVGSRGKPPGDTVLVKNKDGALVEVPKDLQIN